MGLRKVGEARREIRTVLSFTNLSVIIYLCCCGTLNRDFDGMPKIYFPKPRVAHTRRANRRPVEAADAFVRAGLACIALAENNERALFATRVGKSDSPTCCRFAPHLGVSPHMVTRNLSSAAKPDDVPSKCCTESR
jgi:hypothetical protein